MTHKWEQITDETRDGVQEATERLRTPGGWLVRTAVGLKDGSAEIQMGVAFVPDPKHEWDHHLTRGMG